jgi:hypothetical protein
MTRYTLKPPPDTLIFHIDADSPQEAADQAMHGILVGDDIVTFVVQRLEGAHRVGEEIEVEVSPYEIRELLKKEWLDGSKLET